MTDHITSCVNCGDELSDDYDAYCSGECKVENESPAANQVAEGQHGLSFDGHNESY